MSLMDTHTCAQAHTTHTDTYTNTVHIYTMEHYIALEKKGIMAFILTQIDLLDIMYSEIRQT